MLIHTSPWERCRMYSLMQVVREVHKYVCIGSSFGDDSRNPPVFFDCLFFDHPVFYVFA